MTKPAHPWSHPVTIHDVPEAGRHVRLVTDEGTRAAVAAQAEVRELPRLKADFHVRRHGRDGLHVVGRVSATVGQTCVVTLDPIENEVEEEIDVVFTPAASMPESEGEVSLDIAVEDPPEPLVGGVVDLGAVATEFLMLGIDPYPRKPGAAFDAPPAGDDEGHPFAALAALKKGRDEE
jgi:hypothetical protein